MPGPGCAARVVNGDGEFGDRLSLGRAAHNFEETAHRWSVARHAAPHVGPPSENLRNAVQRAVNVFYELLNLPLGAGPRVGVGLPDLHPLRRTTDRQNQSRGHAAGDQHSTPDEDRCHLAVLPETALVSLRVAYCVSIVASIQASPPSEQRQPVSSTCETPMQTRGGWPGWRQTGAKWMPDEDPP